GIKFGVASLDPADMAGVMVVDLLLHLASGEHNLLGVDDDDIVAAIDVGRVGRFVLAAQPQRNERSEAADDEPAAVDQHPLLLDLGGLCRIGVHWGNQSLDEEARFYPR